MREKLGTGWDRRDCQSKTHYWAESVMKTDSGITKGQLKIFSHEEQDFERKDRYRRIFIRVAMYEGSLQNPYFYKQFSTKPVCYNNFENK
jgi:hypothetical protein